MHRPNRADCDRADRDRAADRTPVRAGFLGIQRAGLQRLIDGHVELHHAPRGLPEPQLRVPGGGRGQPPRRASQHDVGRVLNSML